MGIFKKVKEHQSLLESYEKRLDAYDARFANIATSISKLGELIDELEIENERLDAEIEQLKERFPEYDEAVARGVEEVWNKALSEVTNYDPLAFRNKEHAAE